MDLKEAMRETGLSNEGLASLTGMPSSRIAAYKSGGRGLGTKSAKKISEFVGRPAPELVAESAVKRFERAKAAGDREGVYKAMRNILTVVEKHEVDADTESNLDEMMDAACKFLESTPAGAAGGWGMDDDEGYGPEGRDARGIRRVPLEDLDEEDDGIGAEGRDSRGVRVRPMREVG